MPIVDTAGSTIQDVASLRPKRQELADLTPDTDLNSPSLLEAAGAAFRLENTLISMLSSETAGINPGIYEDGYDSLQDIQGTKYDTDKYRPLFYQVYNSRAANALKAQIDREELDKRIIINSGTSGLALSVGAGLADITTLLPGGAVYRTAKGAASVLKTTAAGAAAGLTAESLAQAGLQSSQVLKPLDETYIALGASTIVSGAIGGAFAKLLSRSEVSDLNRKLSDELADAKRDPDVDAYEEMYDNVMEAGGDLSAAKTPARYEKDDLDYYNSAQRQFSKTAVLNPMVRLLNSSSQAARSVAANLPEMGFALKMVRKGKAQDIAAETKVKIWTQGAVGQGVEFMNAQYKAYRKAARSVGERPMTAADFRARVGKAARTLDEDAGGNAYISASARKFRQVLSDPLKDRAIRYNLLPEDVSVDTAPSYFHRMYNIRKIEDREVRFRKITKNWARRSFYRQLAAEGIEEGQIDGYLDEIVSSIYNKITGREIQPSGSPFITVVDRGPLKDRTFSIADAEIEEFLEDDAEVVWRRYARVMGADVELAEKFGRPDMRDQLKAIRREYEDLRKAVSDDKELTSDQIDKRIRALNKEEREAIAAVEGLRDRLRGTHLAKEQISTGGRIVNAVNTYNYMRALGGVTISSFSDISRHLMVHGPGAFVRDGIVPLITNLKAVKLSIKEAKESGASAELINNTRHATWAELTDPYAYGHPVERWLNAAASGFSRLNGMVYWNQFQKSYAALLTQNRILRSAATAANKGFDSLPRKDREYLLFLGISDADAVRIGRLFEKYGQKDNNVFIANSSKWADDADKVSEHLISVYKSALIKDVDSTIVTKGIGDTPLLADQPVWRMVLQFKSFALASNQRVLMRAANDDIAGVMSGMAMSIVVGSMIYYLKQIESGREVSDNPGTWLAEGVDRSGLFTVMMEFNNIAEKTGAPGFYKAMAAMFPDSDQSPPASRYVIRNSTGALLGPSFGLADDVRRLSAAAFGEMRQAFGDDTELGFGKGEAKALRRLIPGSTLPGIKSMFELYVTPALEEAAS